MFWIQTPLLFINMAFLASLRLEETVVGWALFPAIIAAIAIPYSHWVVRSGFYETDAARNILPGISGKTGWRSNTHTTLELK